jgi:hypothetical protein
VVGSEGRREMGLRSEVSLTVERLYVADISAASRK